MVLKRCRVAVPTWIQPKVSSNPNSQMMTIQFLIDIHSWADTTMEVKGKRGKREEDTGKLMAIRCLLSAPQRISTDGLL